MTESSPLIAPDLLAIMQCPNCTGTLAERPEPPALVCGDCRFAYSVDDGIPNMIIDEATKPADE